MISILHRTTALLAALLLAACTSRPSAAPSAGPPALAITNVTVVDVTGGPSRAGQTVLISGTRISRVGPSADTQVPRGARVVDGTGKYVIPGMWDMHSHITLFGRMGLDLYLAHGVTSIRDMGAERFAAVKALRDSVAAGQIVGPRMRIASLLSPLARGRLQAGYPAHRLCRQGPSVGANVLRTCRLQRGASLRMTVLVGGSSTSSDARRLIPNPGKQRLQGYRGTESDRGTARSASARFLCLTLFLCTLILFQDLV